MLQIFLKRQKQAQQPRPGIKFNKAERFPAEALEEDDSVRRSPPRAHDGDEKHATLDRATATANLSMLAETTTGIAHEAHLDGHVLAQPQLQVPETMAVPMTEALPDQTPHLASETKLLPETGTPKKRYEKVDFLQQLASVERDVRRLNQSDSADRLALQRQLEEAQEVSLRINNQLQEAMRISQQEGFVGFVRVTPLEGGADAEFVVPFRDGETVAALKGRIEENEGIPLGMQLLILDLPDGSSSRLTGACSAAAASHVLVHTYGPTPMLTLPPALIFGVYPASLLLSSITRRRAAHRGSGGNGAANCPRWRRPEIPRAAGRRRRRSAEGAWRRWAAGQPSEGPAGGGRSRAEDAVCW